MSVIENTMRWVALESKRNNRKKANVLFDMLYNYIVYHIFPQEYFHYGFYKKKSDDKKTYFTTKLYNRRRTELSDSKYESVVFLDKFIFSKVFNEFYGRKCMLINENTSREDIKNFMSSVKKVVYKPLEACEGNGIKTYSINDFPTIDVLCDTIFKLRKQKALLDEWLIQSKEMNEFYAQGVNCIRIYTFLHDNYFEFVDAKVSFGTDSDIVNATLNGSLFATVDVNTGVITSDLTDYELVLYKKHPVTHFEAKGTKLPCWDQILSLTKRATYLVPQVAYVGWDVALTDKGPVLIEGNHCGGCGGNQFCNLSDKSTGNKELWDVIKRID